MRVRAQREQPQAPRDDRVLACTYTYLDPASGAFHEGYFQTQRPRAAGERIAIRYAGERPWSSATEESLEHRFATPLGILGAGLGLLAWLGHSTGRRRRARAETAAGAG